MPITRTWSRAIIDNQCNSLLGEDSLHGYVICILWECKYRWYQYNCGWTLSYVQDGVCDGEEHHSDSREPTEHIPKRFQVRSPMVLMLRKSSNFCFDTECTKLRLSTNCDYNIGQAFPNPLQHRAFIDIFHAPRWNNHIQTMSNAWQSPCC